MTAYHANYFAHELTKRCPFDSAGKLAASLADAQVDLNPIKVMFIDLNHRMSFQLREL